MSPSVSPSLMHSFVLKLYLCLFLLLFLLPLPIRAQETMSPSGTLITPEGVNTGASATGDIIGDAGSPGEREGVTTAGTGGDSVTVLPGGTYKPCPMFTPLVGIPGLTDIMDVSRGANEPCPTVGEGVNSEQLLSKLIETLYRLAIVAGALIAVLKITLAGLQYMGTDSIGSKEGAKNDIQSALLGLVILLSAVLIMETISGQVNLNILEGMKRVNGEGSPMTLASSDAANTGIQQKNGCQQVGSGTGRECSSGTDAAISGGSVRCFTESQISSSGSTFGPATLDVCSLGGGNAIIQNGGSLEGAHRTTLNAARTELQNRGIDDGGTPAEIRQRYIDQVLTPACVASTGNQNAVVNKAAIESRASPDGKCRGNVSACAISVANADPTYMQFLCSTPKP